MYAYIYMYMYIYTHLYIHTYIHACIHTYKTENEAIIKITQSWCKYMIKRQDKIQRNRERERDNKTEDDSDLEPCKPHYTVDAVNLSSPTTATLKQLPFQFGASLS